MMIKTMVPDHAGWIESTRSLPHVQQPAMPEPIDQLVLPELYCPFGSAVNQHAAVVDEGTNAWVRHHGFFPQNSDYQRFSAVRLGWLAARTHPSATRENLQTVADWCSWFFIRDDYCDETGVGQYPEALVDLHTRFLEILRGNKPTREDSCLTHALHELWDRTQATAPDGWKHRFVHHLVDFFDAGVWEARNRATSVVPAVATYLKMRPFAGGLYAFTDLFDITEAVCLPRELRDHPVPQRLTTMANNIVCWSNDIMSLSKEIQQGEIHNLVLSIRHHQHLTLQEAINRAAALHDAEVRAFIDLELRLPSRNGVGNPELKHYASVLRRFIRGSFDWLYTSKRYLVPIGPGSSLL
jgi:hypothetical protein